MYSDCIHSKLGHPVWFYSVSGLCRLCTSTAKDLLQKRTTAICHVMKVRRVYALEQTMHACGDQALGRLQLVTLCTFLRSLTFCTFLRSALDQIPNYSSAARRRSTSGGSGVLRCPTSIHRPWASQVLCHLEVWCCVADGAERCLF